MTTFRLNAGRPATYPSGGSFPRVSAKPVADIDILPRMTYWAPNMERDTPLTCGCLIPWPVIAAFGGNIHGQIWCSDHGWQPKITKTEVERVRKVAKQCQNSPTQSTLPEPPPF